MIKRKRHKQKEAYDTRQQNDKKTKLVKNIVLETFTNSPSYMLYSQFM